MLRSWSRWLRSLASAQKTKAQKPPVRLGLEGLEAREVPSVTASDFTLSTGDLYNIMGSQPELIDTNVQSFAVRNDGNLYVLHTNNDLLMENPSGQQFADFGVVKAFGLRNDGNGYIEETNNYLYLNTPSQNINFGYVNAFAMRGDGNAYIESANGDLIVNTPSQNYDFGVVTSFGMTSSGDAYFWNTAEDLVFNTPSQYVSYGQVSPLGTRSDGAGYYWLPGGELLVRDGSSISDLGAAPKVAITMSGGRAYYEAPNGSWYLNTASGATSLGQVQGSGKRSDGAEYLWFQSGDLIVMADTTVFGDFGTVKAFAVTTDGRAYMEETNGSWSINTVTQNISLGSLQASGTRNDGAEYLWFQSGDLIVMDDTSVFGDFGPVKAFGMRGDGNAYIESANGDLIVNTPRQNYDFGIVQEFALSNDGNAFYLQNGKLTLNTPAANPPIASDVQSFTLGTGGMLSLILNPLTLPSDTVGQSYIATIPATAASGKSSFTLLSGAAPAGLALSSTGVASGIIRSAGVYHFTVQVSDTMTNAFTATQSCTLTVNPGPVKSFTVNAPSIATVGSGISVSITARDAYGNVSTGYNGTVTLLASNGQSQSVAVKNGTATVKFTPNHSGTITLHVSAGSIGGTSGNINVSPSLYNWTIEENVEYYTDDDGDYTTISTTQTIAATTVSIAESELDASFKYYLDGKGYDWFGLPSFTVLKQQAAN